MKKSTLFLVGMAALLLSFGLILTGCSTDGGTEEENNATKFEGTWRNYSEDGDGVQVDLSYTFKNNTFTGRNATPGEEAVVFSGTFTFTETTITFTVGEIDSWTQEYTLTDTVLTLVRDEPGGHYSGDFQKQNDAGGGNVSSKFEGTWKTGSINNVQATYKFTGNTFVFSSNDTEGNTFSPGPFSGTFVFTDTTISFTIPGDNQTTWTLGYTLNNGTLDLTNSQGDNPTKLGNGTLTKQ